MPPASLPHLGPRPPPAQRAPPYPNRRQGDLLGLEVFRNRYHPCSQVAASSGAGGGLSPAGSPALFIFSVCLHVCFRPAHRRECFQENLSY